MSDPDVNIHLYRDDKKRRKEKKHVFCFLKKPKGRHLGCGFFHILIKNKKNKKLHFSRTAATFNDQSLSEGNEFFCSSCNYSALKPFFRLWVRSVLCLRS